MGLRWVRDRTDRAALGRDHGISRATAYRYIDEVIDVLADQAPDLHQALRRAVDEGLTHLILDGTIIAADRCAEKTISVKGEPIDLWYSGKARHHGGNIQALSAPCGLPLWVSDVEPGSEHDLTAARAHVLGALYKAAADGLPTLADSGYDGAGIGIGILHSGQTTRRRPAPRPRHPYPQHAPARPALPGRTRLRPAHPTLAHPSAHHRRPQQHRRHHQSRARSHPFRTRLPDMKVAEITSVTTCGFMFGYTCVDKPSFSDTLTPRGISEPKRAPALSVTYVAESATANFCTQLPRKPWCCFAMSRPSCRPTRRTTSAALRRLHL